MNESLAWRIKQAAEIHGEFTLRSGARSNLYFDKYRVEADPQLLADVAQALLPLIPPDTEVLGGLEMGGIPIVTMLSHYSRLPAAFIRKTPKSYGTCQYAEGAPLAQRRLVLVEDVVSSGGAILDACRMLRADGISVDTALCVIDRQTGGAENLQQVGIRLVPLFQACDLEAASAS